MRAGNSHIGFLDGLRGLAILRVFIFHTMGVALAGDQLTWLGWLPDAGASQSWFLLWPLSLGWFGVPMFFVISGFCIHIAYARMPDWRAFFARRFFRIYPPYLIALLVFAFLPRNCALRLDSVADWHQLLTHVFLIHNLHPSTIHSINAAFWSVAAEVQLYLLYPLLLLGTRAFGWRPALFVVGAIELGLRSVQAVLTAAGGAGLPLWLTGSPFFFWMSWSFGVALAELWRRGKVLSLSNLSLWVTGAAALATGLFLPLLPFDFPLAALFTAQLMARTLNGELRLPRWIAAPDSRMARLGIISYSVYLLHEPIVSAFSVVWTRLHWFSWHPLPALLVCLCSAPLIWIVSTRYYRWCELPSIAVGKHLTALLTRDVRVRA